MSTNELSVQNPQTQRDEGVQISRNRRIWIAGILLLFGVIVGTLISVRETFGEFIGQSPLINAADTGFVFISACLVMLMTPALALFYGGMVRKKNVLGTMMQSFVTLGVVTFIWVAYGYSLAFGPDVNHLIGNLSWAGLQGVTLAPNPSYSTTIDKAFPPNLKVFCMVVSNVD